MRLSPDQIQAIKVAAQDVLGEGAQVLLIRNQTAHEYPVQLKAYAQQRI
jgi:hypothetical protein